MIPVVIVDDEYLLRKLIARSVDWESLGFNIIGEAKDGEEAYETVQALHPQLVLIDINLPFIDGLELARMINKHDPTIKMIILTGHADFGYAKEAVSAGVMRYLLKPIQSEELTEALMEVKKNLIEKDKEQKYIQRLETNVRESYPILLNNFLYSMLMSEFRVSESIVEEKLAYFNLELESNRLFIIVVEIDGLYELWSSEKERQLWSFALNNIGNEIISTKCKAITFIGPENKLVCIINGNDEEAGLMETLSNLLKIKIKELLRFSVTVGISSGRNGFDNLHLCYNEALDALKLKFWLGNDRVIHYGMQCVAENKHFDRGESLKNELAIALRQMDKDKICGLIGSIYEEMKAEQISKEIVELNTIELMRQAAELCAENQVPPEAIWNEEARILEFVRSRETMDQLQNWLLKSYYHIVEYMEKNKKSNAAKLVQQAKEYIERHYANSQMSLADISQHVFLHPSYLSSIFKKETQTSIIEYINEVRLKQSKHLMDTQSDIMVNQITQQVGYNDPYYFSKIFKKRYGVSPTQYMNLKMP
jgi:two-component system response regulator YesN